ncbi:hypothetical protein Pyn_12450 [Prunus yedoensis var. nudiflora]|uniref:Uncharacterized protein n=1 Tax=Prunus yedoensis var. nudiflora TaxID=2094558 RepID=A0A314YGI2_PRUYE|nr:hypothetical protein Pyn_12450 [Prunus yedoensis var. nudiflora]
MGKEEEHLPLVSHVPKAGADGRFGWIGLLGAEIWFAFYWLLTQASRWNPVYRHTFKDRLSQRYENELPGWTYSCARQTPQ